MREIEMTGKTVELAVQAACDALGVDRDDINVTYEVLDFPVRKLFKSVPARVRVKVEEAQAAAPEAPVAPKASAAPEAAAPVQGAAQPSAAPEAPASEPAPESPAQDEEIPLDIAADARLQAAVDYLKPICELMGASGLEFTAVRKGEATILRVRGDHVGVLIGRRGETMESLSYLTSLVVNRMEGSYVKLGLDVAGYRGKREDDLAALAGRIAERVKRTGCYCEMEPMNPYERHLIHTAIAAIDGVRSESKGEGTDRRVVIYSTDPDACNLPDRDNGRRNRHGGRDGGRQGRGGRGGYRENGRGNGRRDGGRGPRSGGSRNGRGGRGFRDGGSRGSYVPGREFAETPRDPDARPQVPSRSERIHDDAGDDFAFGKIEL
ncbi:MAG TPA: Jag N-terminal domain-containing protein [Candidatus Gemmiger faecigallinarum]|nr:Jag N-terminal domain-containing protein [Candidatus Gemmiger faecigallinarum]